MNKLPQPAKRLILWVASVASLVLASALFAWRAGDPLKLALWVALAVLAGTLKIRFPGLESSYSVGYIVVLAGMAILNFSDAVLVSVVTALVQCYWRASKRPAGVQVQFNLFNYTISGAMSWLAFHSVRYAAPNLGMPVSFLFGATIFFLLNSGLVSWVLALRNGRGLWELWEKSHLLIFPYYLLGAACAGMLAWNHSVNVWRLVAMVPLFGILYGLMRAAARKASI